MVVAIVDSRGKAREYDGFRNPAVVVRDLISVIFDVRVDIRRVVVSAVP